MVSVSLLVRSFDSSHASPAVVCSCDKIRVLSLVYSRSLWVCIQVRLHFWRYGALCLYTVSHVEVWKDEEL